MSASTIFYNGRLIGRPGSYSKVDARGLEAIGLGASGIVALIGTAQGGKPVTAMSDPNDFIRITRPGQELNYFRSGDLYEGVPIAFAPSDDADIQAGAQEIICMKTNPATQSTISLPNVAGSAVDLTSVDYGAHTEQINISVAAGTVKGKLITVVFEEETQAVDNVGGDNFFTAQYTPGTDGWGAMTFATLAGGGTSALGERDSLGLDGDIGLPLAGSKAIEVDSTAADTNWVTVYGLNVAGAAVSERLQLTGTVTVLGTQIFGHNDVLGVKVDGAHTGTVTVQPTGGGSSILTVSPGTDTEKGLLRGLAMFVSGSKVGLVSSGASVKDVILSGTNTAGAPVLEKVALTGTTLVESLGAFNKLSEIVLGDVEVAQTITISAEVGATLLATQDTLQKVNDYYNARTEGAAGFTFSILTGLTTFSPNDLDIIAAVSCLAPAEPGFTADLWSFIDAINQGTEYMTAAKASGATGGAPSNTTAPIFLTGGIEGVASQTEYQTALNLLKQVRVNTIVPLTHDASVHADAEEHCAYMGGVGRSERDNIVGLKNAGGTGLATKTEIKTQIQGLNSRHTRAVAQTVTRYNQAGTLTEFAPHFRAVVAAGMQAGSSVGTSLTYKYEDSLGFSQDTSWNPMDDGEELIQAGLLFAESVEGIGRRWVRNVTTHLTSSNIAYTEGSVNEAVNYTAYTFRTGMETAVGKKGFAGTVNAAKGVAIGLLDDLLEGDDPILTAWRSLDILSVLDCLEVGVEVSPVIPVNFVKNTLHLVTVRLAA